MKRIDILDIIGTKKWLICLLLSVVVTPGMAQRFVIKNFRSLPNDISAYISPIRDLNGEACALIKVVGDSDFAFSTPLGIVKRRNDVGEIWIYVPHGTVQITIKHPQWGVMRDYRFNRPLESRMTYELVLLPPVDNQMPILPPITEIPLLADTTPHYISMRPQPPAVRLTRIRERWHYLALINVGVRNSSPSFGIRIGTMRRHGAYLLLQSDFHGLPDTHGECDKNGTLTNGSGTPYYTGMVKKGRRMILAGAVHRIIGDLCLYEGIGYGRRILAWETTGGQLVRNADYSSAGISAEIGCLYRFTHIAVSAGVATIAGKQWEAMFGIGYHF